MTDRKTGRNTNNQHAANQHHKRPIIEQRPDLPEILQGYINSNMLQKDMPRAVKRDTGLEISLRSIQTIMKQNNIRTTRRNGLTPVDQGASILSVLEDDPLKRWGARMVKEKLSAKGIHIQRDFIRTFMKEHDPEGAESRHPTTRKLHKHGLFSAGPNEEWCVDGHEKILRSMGIAVWGVNDKFSRMELSLTAVPSARKATVPPALYLRLLKKVGGMPVTTVSDKGSELGKLIALISTLRQTHMPDLAEDTLPAHRAVKSVFNITRERGWRPIWNKLLANIQVFYLAEVQTIGMNINDPIHCGISHWLWGKIVQHHLDEELEASQTHVVRKQKNRLLPSGGRRIDFYNHPEDWDGTDLLISVNSDIIDELLDEFDLPEYTQFGSNAMVKLCNCLYDAIGSPLPLAKEGWALWLRMIQALVELCQNSQDWMDLVDGARDEYVQNEEVSDGSEDEDPAEEMMNGGMGFDPDDNPSEVESEEEA